MAASALTPRVLLAVVAGGLLHAVPAWAEATAPNRCLECHAQQEQASGRRGPATLTAEDVHTPRGVSCADCHGGDATAEDPTAAMDPAKGFIGRPTRGQIPQMCARCHADPNYMRRFNPNLPTDQYAKYLTSQHGKKFVEGDTDVAVCTSCHEAHGIRAKKDPLSPVYSTNIPGTCASCHSDATIMDRHHLPVTQHWEYSQSVHGQALLVRGDRGAPHCASCHGSHEAARPNTVAVGNVCAQCHSLTRDLFAKSPHKAAHEALGLPECEVCHGNHLIRKPTDELLGTGPNALCVTCHEPGSAGYLAAGRMRAAIEQTKADLGRAESRVAQAAALGMDVSEAEYALHEAQTKLTQARTYVHAFAPSAVEPIAEEGAQQARAAERQGAEAVQQFHFRRQGLWVTLGLLILVLLGLWLALRDLERKDRSP